jgi:transposase
MVLLRPPGFEEPKMQAITTIGLDIATSVFQVHGVDAEGNVILRRQLKRRYILAFFQKLVAERCHAAICPESDKRK